MGNKRQIYPGVYVVIDPSMQKEKLIHKLTDILDEPIVAVQIWDHFPAVGNNQELVAELSSLCHKKDVPVLINNHWDWLLSNDLDGVHFDSVPEDFDLIKRAVKREFIAGVTCGNDLSVVRWADNNFLDYISFCSVFPSATSNSCELVTPETIIEAKNITSMPVFLAGGIRPENINELNRLPYEGVAVISGIMNSETPGMAARAYISKMKSAHS